MSQVMTIDDRTLRLAEEVDDDFDPPQTALEERQRLLAHHVRLVCRGMSNGLFCYGAIGGLGKSKVIAETLIAEQQTYVLLNSHITALSLYATLFHHRTGKVIWLDDCDALYQDLKILGILRSALWGQNGRIVTYSSSQLGDLPSSFEFESRLIMTANTIPKKNHAFKAVLSRIDCFELSASNAEVLDLLKLVASDGFEKLEPSRCLEVVNFIADNIGTRQLSMRLLEPSLRKVAYADSQGIDWRDLVLSQLRNLGDEKVLQPVDTKAHDMECLDLALKEHPGSVKEQQSFWMKATGKSRASFFRCLATVRRSETKPPLK